MADRSAHNEEVCKAKTKRTMKALTRAIVLAPLLAYLKAEPGTKDTRPKTSAHASDKPPSLENKAFADVEVPKILASQGNAEVAPTNLRRPTSPNIARRRNGVGF